MKTHNELSRAIPVWGEYDVIVCGGGATGFIASIAASRAGARTLLIERYGIFGGTATAALMIELGSMHDGEKRIVGGISHEFVHRLEQYGGAYFQNAVNHSMVYDPESMIDVCRQMVVESGVEILYHTWIADAIVRDGRVEGVIVENKSGRGAFYGRVIIDCTGDGDVAARAGADFSVGRDGDGKVQPVTLVVTVGGIDSTRFNYHHHDLIPAIREGRASGDWPIPTDQMFSCKRLKKCGAPDNPRDSFYFINATNMLDCNGTDARSLTDAELITRAQVEPMLKFLRTRAPGFENCWLDRTGVQVGIRETRRILCDATLTRDDVLQARHFDDGVVNACNSIDVHDVSGKAFKHEYLKKGRYYQIPYGCFLPKQLEGLLVAGRCLSADHAALGSARVMVVCMPMGEAVGTAAAMAAAEVITPRSIDRRKLIAALDIIPKTKSANETMTN
ncbi:MAG: FAD-dependent oxidoreductase [Planctomycetota bacterium]